MKKILSVLLCFLMIIPLGNMVFAAEGQGTIEDLSMNVYSDKRDSIDTIRWFEFEDNYYIFLPSDSDMNNIKVFFDSDKPVFVNGNKLKNGKVTDFFSDANTVYSLACGNSEYKLFVLKSENIPAMFITTESGTLEKIHENKENKESGEIKISQNGEVLLSTSLKQIKGRGNATWEYEKKPYNIKFDEKTDLFGMGEAKKWSLLANFIDKTMLRNIAAFDYGEMVSLDYTSKYQPVDLYINNEYLGNYLVTESVEVGETRVDITDLDSENEEANPDFDFGDAMSQGTAADGSAPSGSVKGSRKWVDAPNDPTDITGGYLLEVEMSKRYDEELSGFVTNAGQPVVLKSPEAATKNEVNYIADFYQEAEDALASPTGYNSKGKHYSEYFDIESFVKLYIIEELSMEVDIGLSSDYFYKPSGEDKLYSGPIWDYDNGFYTETEKERWGINLSDSSLWVANQSVDLFGDYDGIPTIFKYAYMHEDFRDSVCEIWDKIYPELSEKYIENIENRSEELSASAVMDEFRWNKYHSHTEYEDKLGAYKEGCDKLVSKIKTRISYLNDGFSEDTAMLYYDCNGGEGYAVFTDIVKTGKKVTLRAPEIIEKTDDEFLGWNTSPDGKGKTYLAGDRIKLKNRTTTLYARWSSQGGYTFWEKISIFWHKILKFFRNIFDWIIGLFK